MLARRLLLLSVSALAACSACHRSEQVPGRDILADPYSIEFAGDRAHIDVGEPEARVALQGEWSLDEKTEGGASAASTSPRGGLISFRMLDPAESELKVRCRSDEIQAVVPVLNGHRLAEVQVGTEWTEATCRVKKAFLSEGENLLFLKNGTRTAGITVDYVTVGPEGWDHGGGSARPYGPVSARVSPSSNQSMLLAPPRSQLSSYAYVPKGASLAFEFGIAKEGSPSGAGAHFGVTVEDDSGCRQEVSSRDLALGFLRSSHDTGAASLDELAGRTVRVSMRSDGVPPDPQPAFSELVLGPCPLAAMVFNGFKLVAEYQEERAEYELYDLMRDPGETRDVSRQRPVTFHFMKTALREWTNSQALRKATIEKPDPATLDRETEEVLRGLGYIQ